MSGVLDFYGDRMEDITVEDKGTENALIVRRGKSANSKIINDERRMILDIDTKVINGDIIERVNGEKYFVVSFQNCKDAVQTQLKRVNTYIGIYSIEPIYENKKKVGNKTEERAVDVPSFYTDVSATMKAYDAGLLPTTVKKFIMKDSVTVSVIDRIVFNGVNYQVDNIDSGKYANLYEVQVSADTRKTE